jgi:hypothetical protein
LIRVEIDDVVIRERERVEVFDLRAGRIDEWLAVGVATAKSHHPVVGAPRHDVLEHFDEHLIPFVGRDVVDVLDLVETR